MRARITSAALLAAAMLVLAGPAAAQADVTVFAAASLKNALDSIAAAYRTQSGKRAAISYAASSALAKQIEQGAPADLFISADRDWMDYLQERNLIDPASRRDLLGNGLVFVAPAGDAKPLDLAPGALRAALGNGRLATANVTFVPAGKYGKAALEQLGLWGEVSGHLAETENVRAALAFVARGETPLGLVYDTDARAEPKVAVVARLPATSHPAIVYPAALTRTARQPESAGFLEALRSRSSAEAFAREGFTVVAD